MSDIAYLGRDISSFYSAPQFDGFSRVVIIVSEDLEYSAGTDTGRTLTLECPWATQAMADNLLKSISGYQYQPYKAQNALLNPATEIGDALTVNNIYSGIYSITTKFGSLCLADVEAPSEEELENEYPYVPKQNRKIERRLYGISTTLTVQDGLIKQEVIDRQNAVTELSAALTVEKNRITAEVTAREKDVKDLKASITVQTNRITAEVTAREKDVKDLKASIKVQTDRITAEISAREKDVGVLTSSLQLQANQIAAKVSKTGGSSSSFGWTLNDSSWTVNANGSTVFKVDKNGAQVRGMITALSGKIGGFDIKSNYLSYNGQTWGGTNTYGAYLGTSGLQLGQNFRVDMAGNLYAASGRFSGTVYAGNIQYGDDVGYLSGEGIAGGSIYGDRLVGGTITTTYTSSGINGSLGRADAAYNIATGYTKFGTLVGATLSADDIKLGEYSRTLGTTQITYKDGSDKTKTLNVVTWS